MGTLNKQIQNNKYKEKIYIKEIKEEDFNKVSQNLNEKLASELWTFKSMSISERLEGQGLNYGQHVTNLELDDTAMDTTMDKNAADLSILNKRNETKRKEKEKNIYKKEFLKNCNKSSEQNDTNFSLVKKSSEQNSINFSLLSKDINKSSEQNSINISLLDNKSSEKNDPFCYILNKQTNNKQTKKKKKYIKKKF